MIIFVLLDCSEDVKYWSLTETRRQLENLKYTPFQECKNGQFKEEEDEVTFGIMSRFLDKSSKEWKQMVYVTERHCPRLLKKWGCDR